VPWPEISTSSVPLHPGRGDDQRGQGFHRFLDAEIWQEKKVVAFDTLGLISRDPGKRKETLESFTDRSINVVNKIKEICQGCGIPVSWTMYFAVKGLGSLIAPKAY